MIEKVKQLIELMKECGVNCIDAYMSGSTKNHVYVEGTELIKEFGDAVTIKDANDSVYGVEIIVDGIRFYGAVTKRQLEKLYKREVA